MRHFLLMTSLLGVLAGVPTVAGASPVTLLIDPSFGSTEATGATARLLLDFSEDGVEDLLHVTIENTTPASIGSSLTAVGFEVPGSWASSFAPGGAGAYFHVLDLDVSVSPSWLDAPDGYDLMLTNDGDFEGGSPQGAPTAGESESVILSLGDTGLTPEELSTTFAGFYAAQEEDYVLGRFQAVGSDGELSDKVGGGVPEPGTLLFLAFGSLAVVRRTRCRATAIG